MSRRKQRKKDKKKDKFYDPPIWVEGHKLNEKTGELEPVRFKLRKKCL